METECSVLILKILTNNTIISKLKIRSNL
jgi:hypothetical protein